MEHLVQYRIEAIDKITGVYRSLIGLQNKAAGNAAATNSATAKANKAMNLLAKTTTLAGEKISNSTKYGVLRFQRMKSTIDSTEKSVKKTGSSLDWLKGKVAGVERRASMMGSKFSNGLGAITSRLGGLGTAMAGVISVSMVNDAFNTLTTKASDLNETVNKTKVIFGSGFSTIEAFGNSAANTFGLSKNMALESASSFGLMLTNLGMAPNKIAEASTSFVKLGADMASFHNKPMQETLDALQSGLRGEMEPLSRFGITLNEATIKQEAFSLGLIKSTKQALTPNQKGMAISSAIYKQSSLVMGDFARTSDGLANKTKKLTAKQDDLQAKLGQKLLPLKLKFVNLMIKATEWVDRNADKLIFWGEQAVYVGGALLGLFAAAKTIIGVSAFYKTVTTAITILRNSTMLATVATKLHSLANFISMIATNGFARAMVFARLRMIAFNVVARLSPFGWIALAIGGIILLVKHWDTVKVYLSKFAKWAWDNHPFKWLIDLVDRIFPGFKSSLSNMFESIKSVFLKVVDWIYDYVLKPLFGWLGDLVDGFSFSPTVATAPKGTGRGSMGGFAKPDKVDLLGNDNNKNNDLGIKANNEALVSGGGKEIKNINIRIDKLIESFNISTQSFGASAAQIKAEVQKILLSAVNEVNYQ